MTFDAIDLSTISGIILSTMFGIEILKRLFQKNKGFGKIPTFVWAIVLSETLVFVAHYLLKDERGLPILIGRTQTLIWRAFLAAASSSGFYTWFQAKSIADSTPMGKDSKPVQLGTTVTSEVIVPKTEGSVPTVLTNSTTNITKTLSILLCLALFCSAIGCSGQSQLQKAYTARQLYATSLSTLVELRKSGKIDDSAYNVIEPIRANADQATKTWEDLAAAGKTINFEAYSGQVSGALDAFLAWIVKTQNKQ